METEIAKLMATVLALTPIVSGCVAGVKRFPSIKARPKWHAPFAVAFGVLLSIAAAAISRPEVADGRALVAWCLFVGVLSGLGASGLYSVGKSAASAIR